MAAVVRVKRRISEDPAEALLVSCKRQRQDGDPGAVGLNFDERIRFTYAGTLHSKDAPVTRQIRDAISKQKLQEQYKQHVMDISETCRTNKRAASKASRYKVVCKRRAGLQDDINGATESDTALVGETPDADERQKKDSGQGDLSVQNSLADARDDHANTSDRTPAGRIPVSETNGASVDSSLTQPPRDSGGVEERDSSASRGDDVLHVYDVEQDEDDQSPSGDADRAPQQASSSGITFNGVELVSERVPPPRSRSAEAYVYDLYYTNSVQYDFRALENILSIQALHDELVLQGDRDEDCDEVYEDEDDSNDEDNWRNDYPDEDPQFFENDVTEYYYGEDMLAREPEAFDYGEDDDLADWMSARCHVGDEEDLPSDSENVMYSGGRRPLRYGHGQGDSNSSDDEQGIYD